MTYGSHCYCCHWTKIISGSWTLKVSFLNNITLKSGQLLNASPKHSSSFNRLKSLKMFIFTPKTSNNICAQFSAGYHSPNETLQEKCLYSELFWFVFSRIWTEYGHLLRSENHHNIGSLSRKQQKLWCLTSTLFFF